MTRDVTWFWRTAGGPVTAASLRAECERNYRDLLAGVRILAESGARRRLWLVTRRAQALPTDAPADASRLAAATLWGFASAIAERHPALRTTLVDLDRTGGAGDLRAEIAAGGTEDAIAYRDGARHVLPTGTPPVRHEPVDAEHSYVVAGSRGLAAAHALVDRGARHLVLIAQPGGSNGNLAELRGRADVGVHLVDLAAEPDMRRVTARLATARHPVAGIVYAADTPGPAALTWPALDAALAHDVSGGWLLHAATALLPRLRFFTAGNGASGPGAAFLAQLVAWRAAHGLPAHTGTPLGTAA